MVRSKTKKVYMSLVKVGGIILDDAQYDIELDGDKLLIDGLPIRKFLSELPCHLQTDLANIGLQALCDEKRGTKHIEYEQMLELQDFHRISSN